MIAVARQLDAHPVEATAALRAYGVSPSGIGRVTPWHEAWLLLTAAASDTRTLYGAALAGWSYPAGLPELTIVMALGGEQAECLMPWSTASKGKPHVTDEEREAAAARLAADIVIP